MLTIKMETIDELQKISGELCVLSYLQLLVEADVNARNLNISEHMTDYAAEYLIEKSSQTVKRLYDLIADEDFTISV